MNVNRILGSIALGSLITGCAATSGPVTLRNDARVTGGDESSVTFNAPQGWYTATKKSDKVALMAPDNYSSLTVSTTPVAADASRCPEIARDAARGAAKSNFEIKPVDGAQDTFQFSGVVPGTPPGPYDKHVFGRAICRNGALTLAVCSVGVEREAVGQECRTAIESISVQGMSKPAQPTQQQAAPAQPTQPQTTPAQPAQPQAAPAQPAEPQTAPAEPQTAPAQPAEPQTAPTQPAQPQTAPAQPAPSAPGAAVMPEGVPNINARRWGNVCEMASKDLGLTLDQLSFQYAGDSRYVFRGNNKVVEYLLYCSYGNCVWSSDLLGRAEFDLGCARDAITVTVLGEASRGVSGCDKRASYTFNPFNKSWEAAK